MDIQPSLRLELQIPAQKNAFSIYYKQRKYREAS